MNVLHVNTYATMGGAARAAGRLHEELKRAGHQSRIVSGEHVPDRPDMQTWVPRTPLWWLVHHLTWWLEVNTGLEGALNLESLRGWRRHADWADIINLHNLHSYYFNFLLLPRLERRAPLVWTLHDMWALTGHCAYSYGCDRWLTGCGECPQIPGTPKIKRDTTRLLYRLRRWVYGRVDPVVVTPSRWLLAQARRAPLTRRFRSVCIPNGVDLDLFRPLPRESARASVGLPESGRVLFFSAHFLGGRRKGGDLLLEALRRLRADGLTDLHLLFAGGGGQSVREASPYPVTDLGRVQSERLMPALYSASDVFCLPTRADNLPNGLVESVACGTPCVSFRAGGVPEVVRPGETGWLAEPQDAADLARCLRVALTDGEARRHMAPLCRRTAEDEYDVRLMRRRYVSLYEERAEARRCAGRQEGSRYALSQA